MKTYFPNNGSVILTTQEPNAFLNFEYEQGDSIKYIIPEMMDISTGILYINGLDISQDASKFDDTSVGYYLELSSDNSIGSLFLYTKSLNNFDYNLRINVKDNNINGTLTTYDLSINNRPYIIEDGLNIYKSTNIQIDDDTSYLLLRTNPKLSGNIKLVVDNKENMFLDTFKVSDILTNKLYRKQKVSANSTFSGDIRSVFSSLPQGELYKLDAEDTLNIALPKTNLYNQYNINYSYGSRILYDELYNESFGILAPLWINNKLPDYFGLFRIDGNFNEETYTKHDIEELAKKFITEGQLIKSWGIKEKTNLGTYLRNHLLELNNVIAPSFITLSPPDEKNPDPNTWYGVAVDKGIITGRSEVPYFFDRISNNFTDLTAFTTQGFERLNLLCPNLINLEFVFDDNKVDDFTMHRYFGLYLTDNPLYNIAYYSEEPSGNVDILPLDDKNINDFFDSSIFDNTTGNINDSLSNRIFTINDINYIKRFNHIDEVDGTNTDFIQEWINKPGIQLFGEQSKLKDLSKFILLKIKKLLNQGEHLRINDYDNNIIYEIYGIDSSILNPGESMNYITEYDPSENINYPTVRRNIFSVRGEIEDQVNAIWNAFATFTEFEDVPFEVYTKEDDGLSISIKDEYKNKDIRFQRIPAIFYDVSSSEFYGHGNFDDINFYTTLTPEEEDFDIVQPHDLYGPINFEIFGPRYSLNVDFFDPDPYYVYSLPEYISPTFKKYMLYQSGDDDWYRLISTIDVSTNRDWNLRYSEDPDVSNRLILITKHPVNTINYIFNGYDIYPLTVSLMGINPVKDFDTTVYDSSTNGMDFKSDYWYKREGDLDTTQYSLIENEELIIDLKDSFIIENGTGTIEIDDTSINYSLSNTPLHFNTFFNTAKITALTPTIIKREDLDGSADFTSYKDGYSEESILDYYLTYDISGNLISSKKLKYGLTIPTNIKWGGLGKDCRGNELRLNLDNDILEDASSNFIPDENNFSDEIFYPSYKYLTPGDRNWKDYIFYDINDSIKILEDGNEKYYSFKELIKNYPYVDIFSKLVYSNNNINETVLRSSIVYYNSFKNTVDTILNGLSLSISINENAQNILNIQKWNKFRISAISVPSMNRDNNNPLEVFINENTETILIVWYQGNDILNYNLRHSTKTTSKNILDPLNNMSSNIDFKGFYNDASFNYIKTPFGVNTASLSTNTFNVYNILNTYQDDTSINHEKLEQLNLNDGDNLYSIFNAFNNNEINGSSFRFDKSYNTFKQYYEYLYYKDKSTYGPGVNNLTFTYFYNENYYKDITTQYEHLEYYLKENLVEYYIIRNDNIYTNNLFSYAPIKIKINETREYNNIKTFNGWYKPIFNNILNFSSNEDKVIIETTNNDFILGNTNLQSYKNIPQLWYNKVVNQVTTYDISIGNAIDYKKDFNPFYSQWDSGYYSLYDNDGISQIKTSVDGYKSVKELPSYFGSKLPKLPKELNLDSWDSATSKEEYGRNRLTLEFNLSKRISNIFKENSKFINNWAGLPEQSDIIIDGYIKETVLNSYNLRKSSIKVELYTKQYSGSGPRFSYTLDNDFVLDNKANVDGELKYINNEYIYIINTELTNNLMYFVKIILFEK